MNDNHDDLLEILSHVDPAPLSYEEWLSVGQALEHSGFGPDAWDEWSRKDPARYHAGECHAKWKSFRGSANPIKSGTIVALARAQGYMPTGIGHELDWSDTIGGNADQVVVDKDWIQDEDVSPPKHFDPVSEMTTYFDTLFESGENVGYVTETWQKDDGRYLPKKGIVDRTAGQLIEALYKCGGDVGSVLGDVNPEAGAWVRFNPLDGRGVRDENITSYRYALVECDEMSVGRQRAIIHKLELPVAIMVHSGGKSLHAIVRIDAYNYEEYRKRVDYLYSVCQKNGLKLDKQNRNPSRLSRLPGVMRAGKPQYIVERGTGQPSFEAWKEFIESASDDLPDEEELSGVLDNLPDLSPKLICGMLRRGHKMLLAGPSKAGKSFALIELCIALAEGLPWLGFPCDQGPVLYVNLELDRASCLHRFADVYGALGVHDRHPENITIWNLRGHSCPMDKLAPKLIRRAAKKKYAAVIIDPIYKIITGDENSADQMALFCNQFDKVATELGCSVIYCHHHSKGGQGQKKSMDRASGSGVFARDPDALIDLIELPISEDAKKQEQNNAVAKVCLEWLQRWEPAAWQNIASLDDQCSASAMMAICRDHIPSMAVQRMEERIEDVKRRIAQRTAWRIDGTLREFAPFEPRNLWFDYPVHHVDLTGMLQDAKPAGESPAWGSPEAKEMAKKQREENTKKRREELDNAIATCNMGEPPTVEMLLDYFGGTKTNASLCKQLHRCGYTIEKGTRKVIKTSYESIKDTGTD